jgi:dTDP-4-dehydrorhamnose reductase
MRVLIIGGSGQVGRALGASAPVDFEVTAPARSVLDLASPDLADTVRSLDPELIVNAAAYTDVDRAEGDVDTARLVNALAVHRVAAVARARGARLIHLSTDYVFDGKQGTPYLPSDPPCPLSVYGATKLEGEQLALEATDGLALVLRTSWVYAPEGKNFVTTMLKVMSQERPVLAVADQVATPTAAESVSSAVWAAASHPELTGIAHWTDAGVASRYDLAVAIQEEALALGLLARELPIEPVPTARFPTAARRPAYSVLDSSSARAALGVPARHWRVALRRMLKVMPRG